MQSPVFLTILTLPLIAQSLAIGANNASVHLGAPAAWGNPLDRPSCSSIQPIPSKPGQESVTDYRQNCRRLLEDMASYGHIFGEMIFSEWSRRRGVTPLPFTLFHGDCEMVLDWLGFSHGRSTTETSLYLPSLVFIFQYVISECKFGSSATRAGSIIIPPEHRLVLSLRPRVEQSSPGSSLEATGTEPTEQESTA